METTSKELARRGGRPLAHEPLRRNPGRGGRMEADASREARAADCVTQLAQRLGVTKQNVSYHLKHAPSNIEELIDERERQVVAERYPRILGVLGDLAEKGT